MYTRVIHVRCIFFKWIKLKKYLKNVAFLTILNEEFIHNLTNLFIFFLIFYFCKYVNTNVSVVVIRSKNCNF